MNAKKLLTALLAAAVCSVAFIATASAEVLETDVAKIGDEGYETLKAAVESVTDDTPTTIKLICDASGDGIVVKEGRNITIDLGGNTYTIDGALVGSRGTETLGFQLSKDSTVTIMNGEIAADVEAIEANQANIDNGNKTLKMLIQNYADLTLEDVVLDMSEVEDCLYVLSNNCGDTVIDGETEIIAANGQIAMDICAYASYPGVSVTIADTMTGSIEGAVVYDAAGKEDKASFENNSDVDVEVSVLKADGDTVDAVAKLGNVYYATLAEAVVGLDEGDVIEIVGTVEDTDLEAAKAALAEGLSLEATPNDTYTVTKAIAQKLFVRYDLVEETTESLLYNIVLTSDDDDKDTEDYLINRLNSADLTFDFTAENDDVIYEIIASNEEIEIYPVAGEDNRYEFHYQGKDDVEDTAGEIVIGQVKFSGFGKFTFAIAGVDTDAVHATKKLNSIVDSFAPGGELDGKKVNELDISAEPEDMEIEIPRETLTINVTFPNNVKTGNDVDYQSMKITISGGDLTEDKVIKLGGTPDLTATEAVVNKNEDVAYEIVIEGELTLNRTYNVKIEGEGYRTAYATVKMTEGKTLNFWNNVKDGGAEIEVGSGEEVKTSFLAGDIVENGVIDIYDLSAVVSYFGEENMNKYDLNRDGVIDSKDVAYVLVSWNY